MFATSAAPCGSTTSADGDLGPYVPFATIAAAFRRHGLEIDYPEKATPAQKAQLNRALERVADTTLDSISSTLARSIRPDYERFEGRLDASVTETATRVRVITLFGDETVYRSVRDAIRELEHPTTLSELDLNTPRGYEVFIEYKLGSIFNDACWDAHGVDASDIVNLFLRDRGFMSKLIEEGAQPKRAA